MSAQKLFVDKSDFFYQISPTFDFKQSIVSLTFDDGYVSQFTIGIPILRKRNISATFYIITERVDSITKGLLYENLSKEYEFGSHTVTHPDLVKIGNAEANKELFDSKSFLQKYFGINSGLTMSYPWGIYNSSIKQLAKEYYLAARSSDIGFNSFFSPDRYALTMQNLDKSVTAYNANGWVDFAVQNRLWLVEMIHGINNSGYSPLDTNVFIEHLDYIQKAKDKIWCSTVSNVIKYIDESTNATIKCEYCSDTVYNIRVNDLMDDSIYNQPLSIKIKVPASWDSIWISNAGKVKTEYNNKNKFILFNALPDNQLITIRPVIISAPEKESGVRLVYLSTNPVFDNIRLTLEVFDPEDLDIVLCDMNGRILIHQEEKAVNGIANLFFDTSGISNGVYILKVNSKSSGFRIIKKLIKI